ncbi:hypothetical protein NHX12_029797 [Muraenolepis orangiensis]|uniref:BHLH domain-containing protein n=1 Tax=Muraenolepis orangiensis TaxID=630683 RepID=A0A9Q0IIU7_9TELE|nr:hypothetical protein NHX12_029797 [Muraenolepis orangiensis]
MAPTITSAMTSSKEHLTLTHKIRKPLVEKLRRERINSSIEQLQSLLGPEFLKQEPDSKLEKADILEMTVDFNLQSSSDTRLTEAGSPQLSSPLQPSIIKEKRSVNNALWRPW